MQGGCGEWRQAHAVSTLATPSYIAAGAQYVERAFTGWYVSSTHSSSSTAHPTLSPSLPSLLLHTAGYLKNRFEVDRDLCVCVCVCRQEEAPQRITIKHSVWHVCHLGTVGHDRRRRRPRRSVQGLEVVVDMVVVGLRRGVVRHYASSWS